MFSSNMLNHMQYTIFLHLMVENFFSNQCGAAGLELMELIYTTLLSDLINNNYTLCIFNELKPESKCDHNIVG